MRLTNSQTFEIIRMAKISLDEDFKKKLRKLEEQENKAIEQIAKRRQIIIAEEAKRLEEEKEREERQRIEDQQKEQERMEAEQKEREAEGQRIEDQQKEEERMEAEQKEREERQRIEDEQKERERMVAESKQKEQEREGRRESERLEAIRLHNEVQLQKEVASSQIRFKLQDIIQQAQDVPQTGKTLPSGGKKRKRKTNEESITDERVEVQENITVSPEDRGKKRKRKTIEESITDERVEVQENTPEDRKRRKKEENIAVDDTLRREGTPLLDEEVMSVQDHERNEKEENIDDTLRREGTPPEEVTAVSAEERGKRRARKSVESKGKDLLALAASYIPEEEIVLPELTFFTEGFDITDEQPQDIVQYLGTPDVPSCSTHENGEELLSRFMVLLENRLLSHQIDISKSSKGKSKNPTIPSFINNEWSAHIKATDNRSKDVMTKINQLQASIVQTYNLIGSQLAIIDDKQGFIDSKLADICHTLRPTEQRSRDKRTR